MVGAQFASGGESGNKATRRVVKGCVCHPDRLIAILRGNRLNAIRGEVLGNLAVLKSFLAKIGELKIGIEHVDPAVLPVIGRVQKSVSLVSGYRQTGVGSAGRRLVRCESSVSAADRGVPTADRAVEGRENEKRVGGGLLSSDRIHSGDYESRDTSRSFGRNDSGRSAFASAKCRDGDDQANRSSNRYSSRVADGV